MAALFATDEFVTVAAIELGMPYSIDSRMST